MSYLQDKKLKQKKVSRIAAIVLVAIILIYFSSSIFHGLSAGAQAIFRPVIILGGNIKETISSASTVFRSKQSLFNDNVDLKMELDKQSTFVANYNSILDENNKLKEILGRKSEKMDLILAGILAKPNHSLYGALSIDAGVNQGVAVGARVFALGNVPIGRVAEIFPNYSKIILYSNPGEKTDVVINGKDVFLQAVGRGGGNFELVLPRDLTIEKGTEVDLPGVTPYILGTVQTIISDPRDAFQKALLTSPVNVQELNFLEVEK